MLITRLSITGVTCNVNQFLGVFWKRYLAGATGNAPILFDSKSNVPLLHHTPMLFFALPVGFGPTTLCLTDKRSDQTELQEQNISGPGGNRTFNFLVKSQILFQLSYRSTSKPFITIFNCQRSITHQARTITI